MNKTDAEIEKALECCFSDNFSKCEECPLKSELDEIFSCMSTKQKLILDYINRLKAKEKEQQAEIENLKHNLKSVKDHNEGLIGRNKLLKAEIERLKAVADAELDTIHDMGEDYERVLEEEPILIQKAKAEAVKEVSEKITEIFMRYAHLHTYAEGARKDFIEAVDGTEIEMQSVWDAFILQKNGMAEYEVRDVVCDYGIYENGELKLILNSRRIAENIVQLLEEDARTHRELNLIKDYPPYLDRPKITRTPERGEEK